MNTFLLISTQAATAANAGESPVMMRHLTLLDHFQMMGTFAMPTLAVIAALMAGGIAMLIARPHANARIGYSALCVLPAIFGLTGLVTGCIKAFSTLGASGMGDGSKLMAVVAEVSEVFVFGLFGSAITMTLAIFVWLMPERTEPGPPPFRQGV